MSSDQSTASRRQRDDSEDEGPPRQRPRLDDETLVGDDPLIVRHPAFYRPDGDCVLRLENTLFKAFTVHRHLLNVESSAFEGMFALPCGAENKFEGEDDEHPITLFGDTVDQLESFFHYAYLSPLHLQYRRVPTVDIQRLINTAQFCHKYRLLYFEKWAREAIATVCTRRADGLLKTCTPELYVALLELDLLSPQPAVKDLIRSRWIRRLKDDPTMSLVAALDAADKLQSRALLGDLYYLQLQRIDETQAHVLGADAAPPLPAELSDVHKLRLLTGFRSLTLAWTRVAANPIVVGLCFVSHDHDHWEHEWKAAALEAPATGSDLTRKLQTLQKSLAARFAAFEQAGDPPCLAIRNALRKLPGLLKLSQATIPDHFLGPLPEA
ncbi:hypothetical protein C8R46DRAFT_899738 [Mycena filopes]|nr:hypothetical protein C8R46DRAFT_899738 [Mycena filopes]